MLLDEVVILKLRSFVLWCYVVLW